MASIGGTSDGSQPPSSEGSQASRRGRNRGRNRTGSTQDAPPSDVGNIPHDQDPEAHDVASTEILDQAAASAVAGQTVADRYQLHPLG